MSSPAGYARARTRRTRDIDIIWAALRAAVDGISTVELTETTGASRAQVKRTLQALRDAGAVTLHRYDIPPDAPQARVPIYIASSDAPTEAPILRRDEAGRLVAAAGDGELTAADFGLARKRSGLSLAEFGALIGVRDARTVRRYESGDVVIPPAVADRLRRL